MSLMNRPQFSSWTNPSRVSIPEPHRDVSADREGDDAGNDVLSRSPVD
jgi:hypothetical protein